MNFYEYQIMYQEIYETSRNFVRISSLKSRLLVCPSLSKNINPTINLQSSVKNDLISSSPMAQSFHLRRFDGASILGNEVNFTTPDELYQAFKFRKALCMPANIVAKFESFISKFHKLML